MRIARNFKSSHTPRFQFYNSSIGLKKAILGSENLSIPKTVLKNLTTSFTEIQNLK